MTKILFLIPETNSYDYWLLPKRSPVTVSYLTDILCVMMLDYSIRLPINACLRTSPYCVFVLRKTRNKQGFFGHKTNQMTIIRVKIESQNTTSICWFFLFVCQSDYMFRPQLGHHQVTSKLYNRGN